MRPKPASARADLETGAVERDCQVQFSRRSGPGGQNRNKVETAVILTHRPSGITSEAAEHRTQGENRDQALFRMRLKLALGLRKPWTIESRPSPLWISRCRTGRIVVAPNHDDFPLLLAEALDALGETVDPAAAAHALGCTTSQLVRFLKKEPRALHALNGRRRAAGLPRLL